MTTNDDAKIPSLATGQERGAVVPVSRELLEPGTGIDVLGFVAPRLSEALLWSAAGIPHPATMRTRSPFADYRPRLFLRDRRR